MNQLELCYLPAVEALALFGAKKLSPVELVAALIARAEAVESKVNFGNYDLFICPTVAADFVPADYDPAVEGAEIGGTAGGEIGINWFMTYPFNMLSRCPVLNVPSGRAPDQVPTGMQIVGPTYKDVRVFQAAAYEAAVGPFYSATQHPDL